MRSTSVVYICALCALVGSTGIARAVGADSALPTSGGEPAFATRADAMASTVENYIQLQKYADAEQAAAELTGSYPDYMRGWLLLGYCQSRTEDFDGSNDAYDRALALGADSKTVAMRKAYNFIRLGDYEQARAAYRSVIELEGDDVEALRQLAFLEGKLGNYDTATHYYRRVLDQQPDNTEVIAELAKMESKLGLNGEVEALLLKTIEVEPDNTDALGRLGVLYIKDKNYKAAIEPLTTLTTIEPDNVNAHRNLGVAYYQLGDKARARASFEKVSELGGDMNDLYGPLADCYHSTGHNTDALGVIKKGIAADSQSAWLYCMWGKILEQGKDYDGAIVKFSLAAKRGEAPWSDYARKQIARQSKLKKREEIIQSQMQ